MSLEAKLNGLPEVEDLRNEEQVRVEPPDLGESLVEEISEAVHSVDESTDASVAQDEKSEIRRAFWRGVGAAVPKILKTPRFYSALEGAGFIKEYLEAQPEKRINREAEKIEGYFIRRVGKAMQEANDVLDEIYGDDLEPLDTASLDDELARLAQKRDVLLMHSELRARSMEPILDVARVALDSGLPVYRLEHLVSTYAHSDDSAEAETVRRVGQKTEDLLVDAVAKQSDIIFNHGKRNNGHSVVSDYVSMNAGSAERVLARAPDTLRVQVLRTCSEAFGTDICSDYYVKDHLPLYVKAASEISDDASREEVLTSMALNTAKLANESWRKTGYTEAVLSSALDLESDDRRALVRSYAKEVGGVSTSYSVEQALKITAEIPEQDLRDELIWDCVGDSTSFAATSESAANEINALIRRAEVTASRSKIIAREHGRGNVEPATAADYGRRMILQLLEDDHAAPAEVVTASTTFGVNNIEGPERTLLNSKVKEWIDLHGYTGEIAGVVEALGLGERISPWRNTEFDTGTVEKYGVYSWRQEQSVIDIMQNHLDANTYSYVERMMVALYGQERVNSFIERGKYGKISSEIWRLKERYRYGYRDMPYTGDSFSADEAYERIKDIEVELPEVKYKLAPTTGGPTIDELDVWVSADDVQKFPPSLYRVVGIEIVDSGAGFDPQLTASFLSTKRGLAYQRGAFGEGMKMCYLALNRSGCEVTGGATYKDPVTGLVHQWELSPDIRSGDFYLSGRERYFMSFDETQRRFGSFTRVEFGEDASFGSLIDPRIRGLSEYVLDFNTRTGEFVYGGDSTDTTAAIERDIARVPVPSSLLFVQGLEVPPPEGYEAVVTYNFPSFEVFTGRDRKTLNEKELAKHIKAFWSGVEDVEMLEAFMRNTLFTKTDCIEKSAYFSYSYEAVTPEVKEARRQAFFKLFNLKEPLPRIALVDKYTGYGGSSVKDIEAVRAAGFFTIEAHVQGVESYLRALGIETHSMYDAKRLASTETLERENNVSPVLKRQLGKTMVDAQEALYGGRQLFSGESFLAVENIGTVVSKAYEENTASMPPSPVTISAVTSYENGESQVTGLEAQFHVRYLVGGESVPESLTPEDIAFLRFATEIAMIGAPVTLSKARAKKEDRSLQTAQGLVDSMSEATIPASHPAMSHIERLALEAYPIDIDKMLGIEFTAKDEALLSYYEARATLMELNVPFERLQQTVQEVTVALRSMGEAGEESKFNDSEFYAFSKLNGKVFLRDGQAYKMAISTEKAPGSYGKFDRPVEVALNELNTSLVGEKNGLKVYKVESENGPRLFVELPESGNSRMTVSSGTSVDTIRTVNGWRYIGHGYVGTPALKFERDLGGNSNTRSIEEEETSYSSEDFFLGINGDRAFRKITYEDGGFSIPLGNEDASDEILTERIRYFLENYELEIEGADETSYEDIEEAEGVEMIETTLSTSYGEGVWDNPVRIFGDIHQNHADVSDTPKVEYAIVRDGEALWLTEEELLLPENSSEQLVGIAFEDDYEDGFSTRKLSRLGLSQKKGADAVGKFGEGIKMLSGSCVRNGWDLEFESRNWRAKAIPYQRTITDAQTRQRRDYDFLGFETSWGDAPRVGSRTQVINPNALELGAADNWDEWVRVFDPREKDGDGNGGLSRYILGMRDDSKERVIQIGPVSILLDETGGIYEGGILINGDAKDTTSSPLFSIDIAPGLGLVPTRERNVVDPETLRRIMQDVYSTGSEELLQEALSRVALSAKREELQDISSRPDVGGTYSSEPWLSAGIRKNTSLAKRVFPLAFGEEAILDTSANALYGLYRGDESDWSRTAAELNLVEQYPFLPYVNLEALTNVNNALSRIDGLRSTRLVSKSQNMERRKLDEAQEQEMHEVFTATAEEMVQTFDELLSSPRGRELIKRMFSNGYGSRIEGHWMTIKETGLPTSEDYGLRVIETARDYLAGIADGSESLDIGVVLSGDLYHGYYSAPNEIVLADKDLVADTPASKRTAIHTARHELLHAATGVKDYNIAFSGLIHLLNPAVRARYL